MQLAQPRALRFAIGNENIRLDSVAVSLEDGVPIAEHGRQVTPWAARAHDPQHGFDKAPIIAAAPSGIRRLTQTMRLHLRPLGIGQYNSFHPKLESQSSAIGNPDSQQTLVRP